MTQGVRKLQGRGASSVPAFSSLSEEKKNNPPAHSQSQSSYAFIHHSENDNTQAKLTHITYGAISNAAIFRTL